MKLRSGLALLAGLAAGIGLLAWRPWGAAAGDPLRARRVLLLEEENARLRGVIERLQNDRAAEEDAGLRRQIEGQVAARRGIEFLRPVDYPTLRRADLPGLVQAKIAEQFSPEELANLAASYEALGLLPPGFDLRQAYVDLFAEQIAAFYDQHSDNLYLFEGCRLGSSQNRIILAHELTHALQDQHFELEKFPLEIKGNDDLALASASLVEGDATVLMSLFAIQDIGQGGIQEMLVGALTQNLDELQKAPRFLREGLLFPYVQGQQFCLALHANGGFDAVDRAYRRPPVSSAQILHPELYLQGEGFAPAAVNWNGSPVLGRPPLGQNVLGEFGLRILLGGEVGDDRAQAAAAGWAGDGYRVFTGEGGSSWQLTTIWPTAADAAEFAMAITRTLCNRHGLAPPPDPGGQQWTADGPARWVRVHTRPEAGGTWLVGVIDADSAEWAGALADGGWGISVEKQMTVR